MHFNSNAFGELFLGKKNGDEKFYSNWVEGDVSQVATYLTVSNIVTSDSKVVTSNTIRPGTTSGITTKLPQDMITNNVLGR